MEFMNILFLCVSWKLSSEVLQINQFHLHNMRGFEVVHFCSLRKSSEVQK